MDDLLSNDIEELTPEEATELLETMRDTTMQVPSHVSRYKDNPGLLDRELAREEVEA